MALFHQANSNCFVSAQYTTGVLDEAIELQKSQDGFVSVGYIVTPISIVLALVVSGVSHTTSVCSIFEK